MKGAPEYIIPLCSSTFNSQMGTKEFNENDQGVIIQDVEEMARRGRKVLTYATKDIPEEDFATIMTQYPVESDEFRQ